MLEKILLIHVLLSISLYHRGYGAEIGYPRLNLFEVLTILYCTHHNTSPTYYDQKLITIAHLPTQYVALSLSMVITTIIHSTYHYPLHSLSPSIG